MKIINPIYDLAFKYLMQNNRIAKKVLSTLLECEVLELSIEQQEVVKVENRGLKLYRLDFNAVILDEKGIKKKVLIELQKSKIPTNALRFRTYLGDAYLKKGDATYEDKSDKVKAEVYPIISIYILGYNVVDIPYLAINIDNRVTNTVTKEEVEIKSNFVDLLTHKTRIIQVRRLPEKRRTRLEHFLMLFNQAWISKEKHILDLKEIPKDFKDIVNHLKRPVNDEEFRTQLRGEEEIDDILNINEARMAYKDQVIEESKKAMAEKDKALTEKDKALTEKDKVMAEKDKALTEKDKALTEKDKALTEKDKVMAEKDKAIQEEKQQKRLVQLQLAKILLQQNTPIAEVVKITGLTETEIKNL